MWWSYLAAFVLTVAGSFTAARFSGIAGAVFHVEPEPMHIGLLAASKIPCPPCVFVCCFPSCTGGLWVGQMRKDYPTDRSSIPRCGSEAG